MASFTLADILNARSSAQIFNEWLAYLANPPAGLDKVNTSNWRTGGPYLYLIRRYSQELELLYKLIASLGGSAFIRYASGLWLTWLGEDFFGEARQGATFATVNVTLTVTAGFGPYGPQIVRVKATNGKIFKSVAAVTIPAGAGMLTTGFVAEGSGASYNAGATQINSLVSPNVLGVAVSNAAAVTNGYDAEGDDRYKVRLLAKWGILSGAVAAGSSFAMVKDGFIYGAMTASPEVYKVAVLAAWDTNAGAYAQCTTSVVVGGDGTTVSGAGVALVQAYLAPRIGLDEVLITKSAVPVTLGMTGVAKIRSAYFAAGLAPIAASLLALDRRTPIGGGPYGVPVAAFTDAVVYDPRAVYDIVFSNPIIPVALDNDQMLITDPSALTLQMVP